MTRRRSLRTKTVKRTAGILKRKPPHSKKALKRSLTISTIPIQCNNNMDNYNTSTPKREGRSKGNKPLPIMPVIIIIFVVAMVVGIVIRGKGSRGSCVYDHVYRKATCRQKQLKTLPYDVSDSILGLNIGHKLDKSENHFTVLSPSNFTRFTHMQELALIKCGIEEIIPDTFSTLKHLRYLDLRYNRIQKIDAGTFNGISKLEYLYLSNNPIHSLGDGIFSGLNIEELVLENNPALTEISSKVFQGANIRSLTMNRTNLKTIPDGTFSYLSGSLKSLSITNNMQPMDLPDTIFKGLKLSTLDLSNNGLEEAEFLEEVEAEDIDLDDNPLEEIDFDNSIKLSSIKKLSLERTRLSKITKENLSVMISLEELDLEGNDITILNATVFENLDQLKSLDLSNNDIFVFDGDFESEFPKLESLNLQDNDLQTLPSSLEPLFSRLHNLTIHNNPLHCNCEIRWFVKWIESHREVLNELSSVKCDTPESMNLTLISDYGFQCRPPTIFNATFDEDGISLVCTAGGDPAPKVTWISPTNEEKVAFPLRSERKTFQTQSSFTVTKEGNYTCIAANVAGEDSIVVDTRKMPSSGIKYHVESKEIEILETPQGFLITATLLFILGYIIKNDSENLLKAPPPEI